ncbi:MAG: hypothetical protein ACFCGT_21345 [Sandaracinaceae bacterium]
MPKKWERTLGRFAIPNLIVYLVAGQAVTFVLGRAKPAFLDAIVLRPVDVLNGEVWRLVTFLFYPPSMSILFIIFELLLLYIFGRALEAHWGEARFNLYVFIGWLTSVLSACLMPLMPATNFYFLTSIFLAFAYVLPNFELALWFVLPIKVKWLAYLAWAGLAVVFVLGGPYQKILVVAGVFNFFVFFSRDIVMRVRSARFRGARRREQRRFDESVHHTCEVCGKTDKSHPDMQFRYCSQCKGRHGYCQEHIYAHEHVR